MNAVRIQFLRLRMKDFVWRTIDTRKPYVMLHALTVGVQLLLVRCLLMSSI
jgi:dihydropteroate synthase